MRINCQIIKIVTVVLAISISIVSIGSAAWSTNEAQGEISNSSEDSEYLYWNCTNWSALYCNINNATANTECLYFQNQRGSPNPPLSGTSSVIDEGEIVYSTATYEKDYKASSKGGATEVRSYRLIPWMGKKNVAVEGDARKITPIILEQDSSDEKVLKTGESWDLGKNYSLKCGKVDSEGGKVWLSLYSGEIKLDSDILCTEGSADDRTFVAKRDFAGVSDTIYFVTYADNVFKGANESLAKLKYTWLIDKDNVITIEAGDKFGEMECTEASENLIKLSNTKRMELKIDGDTNLTDDMFFRTSALMPKSGKVSKIRYYLYPIRTYNKLGETFELRGKVLDTSLNESLFWNNSMWNALYFNVTDPEESLKYSETLHYQNKNGSAHPAINTTPGSNVIDENELIYSTGTYNKTYEVKTDHPYEALKINTYPSINWLGDLYVAIGGDARSFSQIVCEQRSAEEKLLKVGEPWNLGKNYSLICTQFNEDGGKVWLSLCKEGTDIDSKIISMDGKADDRIFKAEADFAGKKNVIYFVTYVDDAFKSNTTSFVKLMDTWLIDKDNFVTLKEGDNFGDLECTEALENSIKLSNRKAITLKMDNKNYLMSDMYLKTSATHKDGGFSIYPGHEVNNSLGASSKLQDSYNELLAQDKANDQVNVSKAITDLATDYNETDTDSIRSKVAEINHAGQEKAAIKSPGFEVLFTILCLLVIVSLKSKRKF
jgi:S-layer protein (TIGR01567 family)